MSLSPTPSGDGIVPGEDRRVRQVVDIYMRQYPAIPGYDREDLCQEGRLAWFEARSTYRADRGASVATYIGRVVEHRLLDLARRAAAARRRPARRTVSLDAPLSDHSSSLADLLPDLSPGTPELAEQSEIAALLTRVRQRLRPRERDVFDALSVGRQRAQTARDLGVSRDTVYEDIRRIQDACRDAGLEAFLG